VPVRQSWLRR